MKQSTAVKQHNINNLQHKTDTT